MCDVCLQDEVAAARPDIDEKTAQLVSKGRWGVPGYKVRSKWHSYVLWNDTAANMSIGEIRRSFYALNGINSASPFLCCLYYCRQGPVVEEARS